MRNYFISAACVLLLGVLGVPASAAVLYSGGNPGTVPSSQPPGSGMAWSAYSNDSSWTKPYVGAVVAAGDKWTVTGYEFYAAVRSTDDPVVSVRWDIRTTAANLDAAGAVASGSTSQVSYVDSGFNMTYVYNYDIYKFTVNFDTPIELSGGETYYFSAMLYRGKYADTAVAIVFSNGTGTVGISPDTVTDVWDLSPGYSPYHMIYNSSDLAFSIIGFSAVPEPTSVGMLAAGALVVAFLRRRKVAGD